MAQDLDSYKISFISDGLKEFETELKRNEKELDKYEKEVTKTQETISKLNKKKQELSNQLEREKNKTNQNTKAIEKLENQLKDVTEQLTIATATLKTAENQVTHFKESINNLKGTSQYSFLQLTKSVTSLVKQVGLLAVVGTTIRKSLQFYEQAEQLDFLAEKTGIAADKLQELGNASSRFGGNTESTATSIENIRTNRETYTQAGIRIENDPSKTLENVARKMETLSNDRQKWDLADSLGIDEATTRMLIQGVEKYNAGLKKGAKYKLYTKEDMQRMRDYRHLQQVILVGLDRIGASIYQILLPAINIVAKIIRKITDRMAEHKGAVKIIGIFVAIAAAIGGIVLAVNLLSSAITLLEANPVVLIIIAVIAAITALIAIINDLIVFVQGGYSLIGDILEDLGYDTELLRKDILAGIELLKQGFNELIEWLKSAGDWIVNIFNTLKGAVLEVWNAIPDPIKKMMGAGIKASLLINPMTALPAASVMMGQKFIERYEKDPNNAVPAGAQTAYYSTQSQNANTTNNSRSIANNRNNNIKVDNINIQTQANNPQQVAQEVGYIMTSLDNAQRA